jgi:hypothetical protein
MVTKDETAKELAKIHFEVETGLSRVFRITGSAETEINPFEPIILLEVNTNSVLSGVMPLQFGPAPASGVFYPYIIVEVTPEEYQKIQLGELTLPVGWTIGEEVIAST